MLDSVLSAGTKRNCVLVVHARNSAPAAIESVAVAHLHQFVDSELELLL